jgi:hypothetical protein
MPLLRTAWVTAVLAVIVGGFYAPTVDDFFKSDDFVFLDRASLGSPSGIARAFSIEGNQQGLAGESHSYRPLSTNVYFGSMRPLFGLDPRPYHAVNLLLLVGIAALLVQLLVRFGCNTATAIALAASYATSGIAFQTQLWLSLIQELTATTALLAALLLHVSHSRGQRTWTALLFAASLLCKEIAVTFPAIVFAFEWIVRRATARDALRATAPLWAIASVYLALRLTAMPISDDGPYAVRVGTFVASHLATYGQWTARAFVGTSNGWVLLGLGAAAFAAIRQASAHRRRLALFGLAWIAIAIGPVILLPSHVYVYYLLFPGIGAAVALAALLDVGLEKISLVRLRDAVVLVAVAGLVAISYGRFQTPAREHAEASDRYVKILANLRSAHPRLPPGTTVYFDAEPSHRIVGLVKGAGASLRLVYHDASLRAQRLRPETRERIRREPDRSLAFRVHDDGSLLEIVLTEPD